MRRPMAVVVTALLYMVIGFLTAQASKAHIVQGSQFWRLAAWVLSAIVFVSHLIANRRYGGTSVSTASMTALAVALGGLGVALVGPVRAHWGMTDFWRSAALSVILWPLITGIPAFCAAFVLAKVLPRFGGVTLTATRSPK